MIDKLINTIIGEYDGFYNKGWLHYLMAGLIFIIFIIIFYICFKFVLFTGSTINNMLFEKDAINNSYDNSSNINNTINSTLNVSYNNSG